MSATTEIAELAMQAGGLTSEYQLAQALNISAQRVAHWRKADADCDDDTAVALAKLAGINPGKAVLLIAASRSKSLDARRILRHEAERLAA